MNWKVISLIGCFTPFQTHWLAQIESECRPEAPYSRTRTAARGLCLGGWHALVVLALLALPLPMLTRGRAC